MAKGNMSARAFRRQGILGLLRGTVATVSSAMVAVAPALPAYADAIVADGRTDTQIVTSGNITDITTGTIHGGNAFNSFERFSVEQLRTVNLHQPDAAGALINVIRGGITNIDGTLNVLKGGEVGGNVFLVNPEGLVVGAGGVVNAGALTVSTGSHGFAERLIGADGAISDDAVAQLFAGTEELSPSAAIALYGEINARRLEMRAGARMILDGRINVIDAAGSQTAAPAVNTAGTENAAGVSVSGGVIRLHAEGDMQVGGQISAQAGNDGGRIAATAGGDIDVAAGAQISADGETGGSVFLFADGSALLEQGARISASAIAGDGGFIEFSARDHVGFAGELDVSSETGRAGTVYIDPANLTISTDIITGGANWILQADDTITVEDGVVISTRRITGGNHATAASTGNSGDLILSAREIVIEQNAGLYTHADAGYSGGLLALLARDDAPAGLPLLTDGPTARVDITGATLRGGAIYIGAYARATDVTTPSDPGSNGDFLKTALDVGLDVAGKLISGEEIKADDFVSSLQGLTGSFLSDIPAQFAALNATAEINITNSEITAQDNWAGMTADTEFDGTLSDNKVLAADGLAEDVYNFTGQNTSELTGKLASAFRESGAALYIHSHAQTDLSIAPQGDDPLNIVIAFSDTTSTLRITNSQLASAGDLVLNSTAHENFSGAIAAKSYANVTPGVVISARNLTNQLVVDGGAMTAGGTITAQALTGLNHDVTTAVDGGKDGVFALAAAVSIGSTLTEAALSGTIAADQGIDLRAETIWFKNSHAASATLGVDDPADAADESEENDAEDTNTSLTGFFDKLKDMVLGKQDPAPGEPEPENSKPGFAGALAVAITLDDNDTYASLGGSYRDLTDGSETTLGTTTVSAGDVAVNAGLRFASSDEGGAGISRVVTSSAASLSDKQRQELEKYNRDKPEDQQKTEEEFINEFGYGVFLNVPITSLTGTTQAELGGNLTITDATSVTAAASTAYPNARPWDDLRDFFTAYLDAATEFVSPETREDADEDTGDGDGEDGFGALPSLDSLDLDNYLTTKTGASATAPSGSGSGGSGGEGGGSGGTGTGEAQDGGQELAIGVTVGYFNTANTTRAVVRDGADITTTGALDVQALAEGFFYHRANEIELPKLDGGAGANNAIGGAINLARTVNTVEALIGAADIDAQSLAIDAKNDTQTLVQVYAGGNAQEIAINASVGVAMMENRTVAQLSDAANVDLTGALNIRANDAGAVWSGAGAASVSGNVGVGASGVVNFMRRETLALIGPEAGGALAGTPGSITAGSLTVKAENSGVQIAAAIAGAVIAAEKPDTSANPPLPPAGEDDDATEDDDMIIPSWFFDEEQNAALDQQTNIETEANDNDQKGSAGWAISGSAALNLLLANDVTAGVHGAGVVTITDALVVAAENRSISIALGGAISASADAQSENNALAGGFAVTVDGRETLAYLRGATVDAGSVAVTGQDNSTVVSIAVGGAGTARGKLALAGSVAVNVLTGGTTAEIADADITADALALDARDSSTNVGVGGAVAVNLDKAGAAGVGLSAVANVFERDTLARLAGGSVDAGRVDISAAMDTALYGFAISAGIGKTGIGGSVAVNTLGASARAIAGGAAGTPLILRTTELNITASDDSSIWSLAGAIAGGFKTAVGGAVTVNVGYSTVEAALENADLRGRGEHPVDEDDPGTFQPLGAVQVQASSDSEIGTLAAAGAGAQDVAVGLALSGNAILADTIARLEHSQVDLAESVDVRAVSNRAIRSLGGAAAFSGRGAVGAAVTVNVLDRNQTIARLDHSHITTDRGGISAVATAKGLIESASIALGASGKVGVSGAVTVNITTATTIASAEGAALEAETDVTLRADDESHIRSLALGAAGGGHVGAGAAIAANVIAHDTAVVLAQSDATARAGDIALTATNAALIETLSVAAGASGSNAFGGSIAVAYIGNSARVAANDVALNAEAGEISLDALKTSHIRAISGAAAAGSGNAVGAAITVAIIQDTVAADLATGRRVAADSLAINAINSGRIDAIGASGGVSGSSFAGVGSLVYTQIGKPPSDAAPSPRLEGLESGEENDPIEMAETETAIGRDQAFDFVGSESALMRERMGNGGGADTTFDLGQDDITRASLTIAGAGDLAVGQIAVNAREVAVGAIDEDDPHAAQGVANIRSLAGAVGVGGTGGLGAAFTVNLLFGQTLAEVVLPTGSDVAMNADLSVRAEQGALIQTMAASAGAGGTAGIAGSVTVNVMNRNIAARVMADGADPARITTGGGNVTVSVDQTGTIQSLAGAVGGGGTAGVGVAVGVNVLADSATAEMRNIRVDTEGTDPDTGATWRGDVNVTADQEIRLDGVGVSAGMGGTVGLAGSFSINVNSSDVTARLYRSDLRADAVRVSAHSLARVFSLAGVLAGGGTGAGALGVGINVSSQDVLSDLDGSRIRALGTVALDAYSDTNLSGNAVGVAVSGTVSVTGSVVTNVADTRVRTLVRNTGPEINFDGVTDEDGVLIDLGGADVLTQGTVLMRAAGRNTILLAGGQDQSSNGETPQAAESDEDGLPTINISFAGGGVAGVGVSVSLNKTANVVDAVVTDASRVVGLGHSAATSARLGSLRGVAIEAYADTDISMLTVNAAAGAKAGVAGLFGFNIVADTARVTIGDGTDAGAGAVNTLVVDEASTDPEDADLLASDLRQDSYLMAAVNNDIEQYNVALGAGLAGVGAASGTTVVNSIAETRVDRGTVFAARNVTLDALSRTDITNFVVGAAGGAGAVAGSVGVNIMGAQALVTLMGANITAGERGEGPLLGGSAIKLNSHVDNSAFTVVGGLAAGGGAAAGAVQVNVFDSTSEVRIGSHPWTDDKGRPRTGETVLRAGGAIGVAAETDMASETFAGGGAIGGFGLAASINVNLVTAETLVTIDPGQSLHAGGDLALNAAERVNLRGISGVVAGGASAGMGASLDYASFAGKSQVTIGTGSDIAGDGDVRVAATAERMLDSTVVVVAAGGSVGLSASLSIIAMGGDIVTGDTDEEAEARKARNDLLAGVQSDLDGDQSTGTAENNDDENRSSVEALAALGNAGGLRGEVVGARQSVDVTAAPAGDDVGVSIGADVQLRAGGDLRLISDARVSASQTGGAVAGGFAGIGAGVLISNIGVASAINIGANAQLRADERISLSAKTGPAGAGYTIDAKAFTAGVGAVGISAGVAVARASSLAEVTIAEGVVFAGNDGALADAVTIDAARADVLRAEVLNIAAGAVGAGLVVVDATIAGRTAVAMNGARIHAGDVAIRLADATRADVGGIGAAGGIVGAGNGVIVIARNQGALALALHDTRIEADEVALDVIATSRAQARADGVAVSGGLSIGASFAQAQLASKITTDIVDSQIVANDISLLSELRANGGHNVQANAFSASGGVLAGNGAVARALLDYTMLTNISADLLAANGKVSLITRSGNASASADVRGVAAGVVALGAVMAEVGQSAGKVSQVLTNIGQGQILARDIFVRSEGGAQLTANTEAGSGGVAAGSATVSTTRAAVEARLDLGRDGALKLLAMGKLDMRAGQSGTLHSSIDNFNATLVGVSGAKATTTYASTVETRLHGVVEIDAAEMDLGASNTILRPRSGHNIQSGSGGAFDLPAMVSDITIDASTRLTVDTGVRMTQMLLNALNEPALFRMGAASTIDVTDRLHLDAGGAIAVPIGRSSIKVNRDDTIVSLGAVRIFSEGDLRIYSGSNVDIHAEVDANSYGFAGAATGETDAVYRGVNDIVIAAGADLESMRNIRLGAGEMASQAQNVNVRAETRVFNKTAIPIPTDPRADAVADTRSRISVAEGASVQAVQDVYLHAIGGNRNVEGYGRGTDLWREVAAAIANAIGGIFGAAPVALDIKSGTTVDRGDNGVIVNGYVRAGSRNSQRLLLDQNNELDLTYAGYEEWEYENIEWKVLENVSVAADLQARVDELNDLLANDFITGNQPEAKAAWEAERTRLLGQLATHGDALVDLVDIGPIRATGGNIFIRADYVHGSDTGTLQAPGDALIDILVTSDAFIRTDSLTIPARSGGLVTFNDVPIEVASDIRDITLINGDYDFDVIQGLATGEPEIKVYSTGVPAGHGSTAPIGTIIVNGPIENLRGKITVQTLEGDIDVRADIAGLTVVMEATNGNFIQGYKPGISNAGGTPIASAWSDDDDLQFEGQYGSYYRAMQESFKWTVRALPAGASFIRRYSDEAGTFTHRQTTDRITAGKNVFITADVLNINGLIQAGRGTYDVDIRAGIDAEILARYGASGSGTILIHNPSTRTDGDIVVSNYITSDVPVYYNFDEGRIEVGRMVVQGGQVELVGNIMSTGSGRIEALDGFGQITVTSDTMLPVGLQRIDAGAGASGTGVAGIVRITDTAKTITVAGHGQQFLTTEYRRQGNELRVYDNRTVEEVSVLPPDFDLGGAEPPTRLAPTNLVRTITANGGRDATYDPTANRDLIYVVGERVVTTRFMREEELVVIGLFKTKRKTTQVQLSRSETTNPLGAGPYLGESLGGVPYDYAFVGRQITNTTRSTAKVETHNSVRWWKLGSGWIHRDYQIINTTESIYEHRLNASQPIDIHFAGSAQGLVNIQARGDVFFLDTVINVVGDTTVNSSHGSLFTADPGIEFNTANTTLAALGGSITGMAGEFRMNQVAGSTLTLTAQDNVFVREMGGTMNIVSATALNRSAGTIGASSGNVHLIAHGDIRHADATGTVSGAYITLESTTGQIGQGASDPLRVNTEGGRLNARAAGDITLSEVAGGDGDLHIDQVESIGGSVTLIANHGSILDRNDVEERDIRTEAELVELYVDAMGLYGTGVAAREARQLAGLKAAREAEYAQYWQQRGGGGPISYEMGADTLAGLEASGWDQSQIDAYIAEREALYDLWNGDTAFDPGYSYLVGADEAAGMLEGISWTPEELTRSISAGLVRQTGDTRVRNQDPNVVAGRNITLIARDSVGELIDDYVINVSDPDYVLSADDLLALASADRLDLYDEDGNMKRDADGNIRITQRETLDFAFKGIDPATGLPVGTLRVVADDREIFLGAETPVRVEQIHGQGAVQVLIDGAMADAAQPGSTAVRGTVLVLESGNNASIGTGDNPLSVEILPGGSLNARSGHDVYITAPFGGVPVEALFAGRTASITAAGAITDNVGNALPRIVADNIILSGATIGADDNLLGIELSDEVDGRITLETTSGDINLDVVSAFNLASARLAAGGLIVAHKGSTLFGEDTLIFGALSRLVLDLADGMGVDLLASGVNIAGHDLTIRTGGQVGADGERLITDLDLLDYIARGEVQTALWLDEVNSITLRQITQNLHAASVTDVQAGEDITLGTATSLSRTRLAAGRDIVGGRITAELTELESGRHIDGIEVVTGLLRAETDDGDATILLRDRAVDVDFITVGGSGALALTSRDAPVTLLAAGDAFAFGPGASQGHGITTAGGALDLDLTSLLARADIRSHGGNIGIVTAGDMVQADGTMVDAQSGEIAAQIGGDMILAAMRTDNATDQALALSVLGTLSRAGNTHLDLDARASGALSTLRLGAVDPVGPLGLRTDLDRADAVVQRGGLHLNDDGRITLESVRVADGNLDIFAGGEMVIRNAAAQNGDGHSHVTLSALGDIRADAATMVGDITSLFAFGGNITGETQGFFQADTADGMDLRMLADRDIHYREMAGDLLSAFVLAGNGGVTGDLVIDVVDGSHDAALMGAMGEIRIEADDIRIGMIGRARIDIADEVALQLVRPEYFGTVEARAPRDLSLTAHRVGGGIDVGLANVRQTIGLHGDIIDVRAYDPDPADNLVMTITDATGGFADQVHARVVGDGPAYAFDDPTAPFTPDMGAALHDEIVAGVADRLQAQRGTLYLVNSMIGQGEVIHAGPYFVGTDNRIDGDVYFRQRDFDLYAHVLYQFLDVDADAQVYAFENEGRIGFTILGELILTTEDVLVLNRKLAGVSLDGGQGYTYGVGVETEILGGSFIRGTAPGGVVSEFHGQQELFGEDDPEVIIEAELENRAPIRGIDPALAASLQASL